MPILCLAFLFLFFGVFSNLPRLGIIAPPLGRSHNPPLYQESQKNQLKILWIFQDQPIKELDLDKEVDPKRTHHNWMRSKPKEIENAIERMKQGIS